MKCPSWTRVTRQERSSDRAENGKCTNVTNGVQLTPIYTLFSANRRKWLFKWRSSSSRSKVHSTKSFECLSFVFFLFFFLVSFLVFFLFSSFCGSSSQIFCYQMFAVGYGHFFTPSRVKSVKQKTASHVLIDSSVNPITVKQWAEMQKKQLL